MGASRSPATRRDHLRLVEPVTPSELPRILTDRSARKEFEELTQALVDAAIEIMDLVDGDADSEPDGDEFEDDGEP